MFFLLPFGVFKFFAFEAESIRPLKESSPLVSWTYWAFGFRGATALLGVFEVAVGSEALLAARVSDV
jgi:hypothetical protein